MSFLGWIVSYLPTAPKDKSSPETENVILFGNSIIVDDNILNQLDTPFKRIDILLRVEESYKEKASGDRQDGFYVTGGEEIIIMLPQAKDHQELPVTAKN